MLIARYLVVGGLNSIFGLAVIMACMAFFAMPAVLANATGYIVGFVLSFLLHRHYTFRSNIGVYKGMISYLVIVAGAYMANILALLGSINLLNVSAYIGQGLGVLVYVLLTFIGSRKFVFNRDAS